MTGRNEKTPGLTGAAANIADPEERVRAWLGVMEFMRIRAKYKIPKVPHNPQDPRRGPRKDSELPQPTFNS